MSQKITPHSSKPNQNRQGQRARSSQLKFGEKTQTPHQKTQKYMTTHQKRGNSSEMQSLYQQLQETNDISQIETENLSPLLTFLREYAHARGAEADYDEAEKANEYANIVRQEIPSRRHVDDRTEQLASQHSSRVNAFEEEWNIKFENFDSKYQQLYQKLLNNQKKELDDFEKMWNEDMPRKYRKPSTQLLQLKQIEKSLAATGDFERAKMTHQRVEQMANDEQQIAQENLIRDYNFAKRNLRAKHQREIEQHDTVRDQNRQVLESQYQVAKRYQDNRAIVIDTRKREAKSRGPKRSIVEASVTYSDQFSQSKDQDVLLPPLRPPNDPTLRSEQREKARQMNQKKQQYQKRNAATTLSKFTVDGSCSLDATSSSSESGRNQTNTINSANKCNKPAKLNQLNDAIDSLCSGETLIEVSDNLVDGGETGVQVNEDDFNNDE